ncbi:hypothetical protein [Brachybacterium phenoliresistens]|uniref:Uncharacterized protein n=1 Tax=Brachybacterium phenoliresistens TaxID=396014 RepID=Z9JMV6_9MICO|nr:hypothetical protein [Brachybacterium phenoliresistens]EWS79765.1 hypothetical protein BF93_09950 [Brachybacterium phenoliresistens]
MSTLWTSPRTGYTYDVTSRDNHGYWKVVDAPTFVTFGAVMSQLAVLGGVFTVAGMFSAFGVAFLFVGITMGIARWFVTPVLLAVVCLALLVLPEGRRRWPLLVGGAAFCLLILLPGTLASMYLLGPGIHTVGTGYAWAASLPLVPVMFFVMAVWLAIRRSVWGMVLSLLMGAMTGLMSLLSWVDTLAGAHQVTGWVPPAAGPMAMDNILSVLTYLVVAALLAVVSGQVSVSLERRMLSRSAVARQDVTATATAQSPG